MFNHPGDQKKEVAVSQVAKGISIVTFPLGDSAYAPLLHLAEILRPHSERLYILSGGEAKKILEARGMSNVITIRHEVYLSPLKRAVSYAFTNLKFLAAIISLRKRVGLFVFFIGAESLFVPMLGAKLLGVKTVLMPAADSGRISTSRGDPLAKTLSVLTACNLFLADILVLYSENTIEGIPLGRYRHKVFIGHEHFVDLDKFGPKTRLESRARIVGFVGRLDREKGILNLIQAIPMVLDKVAAEFVICGDGPLRKEIVDFLDARGYFPSVRVKGWVNHEALPSYFNEFRLLVFPSYTEGIGNVALEAMACGTPVLMTKVGALAEIATDGRELFFLDSNDPQYIAERITSILSDSSKLMQVSEAALEFVRKRFSYQSTSQIWDTLLSDLGIITN